MANPPQGDPKWVKPEETAGLPPEQMGPRSAPVPPNVPLGGTNVPPGGNVPPGNGSAPGGAGGGRDGQPPKKRPSGKVFLLIGVAAAVLIALAARLAVSYGGGGAVASQSAHAGAGSSAATAPSQGAAPPASMPAADASSTPATSMPEPRPEGQPAAEEMRDIGPISVTLPEGDIWYFASGTQPSSNALVGNIDSGGHDFYFALYHEADVEYEEPLYVSGMIPEGYMAEGITLDEPLDAGTYTVECVFYIVNEKGEVFDRNNTPRLIDLVIKS